MTNEWAAIMTNKSTNRTQASPRSPQAGKTGVHVDKWAAPASHAGFAERIGELIGQAKSQRAFAAMAGVNLRAVQAWLQGSEPSRDKLAAISAATGADLNWLIRGGARNVPMRFVDLIKSEGFVTHPFFAGDQFIFLPKPLLGNARDPMAVLLPAETPESSAGDFVVFDFIQGGKDVDRILGDERSDGEFLCVVIDKGKVCVRRDRSFLRAPEVTVSILGLVIFRGTIVRLSTAEKDRTAR